MFRSFLAQILLLQCLTVSFITVGYYSTHQQKKQVRFAATTMISEKTSINSQSEVAIFWTPKKSSSDVKYNVVRKNVQNRNDESLLATINSSDDLSNREYFKVSDRQSSNNEYSYQVVQITPQGSQVIASLAYAMPKTNCVNLSTL